MRIKKILVTGMNSLQTKENGFLKQQLKVAPSHYSLLAILRDLGYEVEQRQIELGEDLSQYDEVVFYVHTPQTFCQNLYTGLYALSAYPDAIIAFDDWQVDQITKGLQSFLEALEANDGSAYRAYTLEMQNLKVSREEFEKYNSNYIDACKRILSKQNRLLISAFAGGDLDLLKLGWNPARVFTFNPNPYHYNRTPENDFLSGTASLFGSYVLPEDKQEAWNFASLAQKKTAKWLKNQHIKWPVHMYGERGVARLTEDQMCKTYATHWGCLMPGYHTSGSGWWRARPLQVADAGSILIGEPKELYVYYRDNMLSSLKASDIEVMDVQQRTAIAKAQRDALYDVHPLTKQIAQMELIEVLEAR